jgi:Delta24-sterol reductase
MGTMDFAFRALVVAVAVAAFWAGLMGVTLSELQAGDASLLEHKLQAFGPLAAALAASRPAVALAGALLAAAWLYGAAPGEVIAYTITHHRWVLACFLMPVSFVFDGFWMLRSKLVFLMGSAPEKHDERVRDVQDQVREWAEEPRGQKMCTARAGWLAMSLRVGKYKSTHRNIRIELRDVLEVDTDKRTVRVEPMVTMGQISATLEPLGWTLAVLPELDDLTVGGLINGCGVESSSHIYGMFQETIRSCELVMADGELVHCSEQEEVELFRAVPWSHGTLGFLVAAELTIVPAKPWVRLEYHPCHTKADSLDFFKTASADTSVDFVEGLVYSADEAVIMVGTYADDAEVEAAAVNRIGRWFKPWWYTHVETYLGEPAVDYRSGALVEYIPLRDWYHRHTKSIFWELEDIIPFGNHVVFRWLFGWAVPPKIALIKLTQTEEIRQLYEKYHVVQDMLVPLDTLGDALSTMDTEFEVYPLWLCPMKVIDRGPSFLRPSFTRGSKDSSGREELYVDIGAYGNPQRWPKPPDPSPAVESTRTVEEFVRRVGGFQMLYADSYMSREEFEAMFDHGAYRAVRQRFHCEKAFPEVYDKVCKAARH